MVSCYSNYKDLHEEAKKAVTCPKSSQISTQIKAISKILSSLNLEWNDSVKENFEKNI